MIRYKSGYKYQLVADYSVSTGIKSDRTTSTRYIHMSKDGELLIKAGYASDGGSGPTIDTKNTMRGVFVHDALFQLMRQGHLNHKVHRKQADKLLRKMLREDGMSWVRAAIWYYGLRIGGRKAALPESVKITRTAP